MVGSHPSAVVVSRLKREDCKRTKHDPVFSQWKILVGPCDWEDYLVGKDGAERYRVHNLPRISCPGVYELAIAVSRTGLGRNVVKLDPECILVVYLGQAENVRTRLQRYGRTGSHLGTGSFPTVQPTLSLHKGPGLFEDILSRGYPIVFRWASMQSKSDAQKTETQLLNTFDYAWNISINGSRRPDDILEKLKKISSSNRSFPAVVQRLLSFGHRQVGIRIKAGLLSKENNLKTCADEESPSILSRVFKFGRSRPRLVSDRSGITRESTVICGVALTHASVCTRPPVEGRKRCAEHKGMKINGMITVGISNSMDATRHCDINSTESDGYDAPGFKHDTATVKHRVGESFSPTICGFTLTNGSPCKKQAIQGNKRCDEHRGRRTKKYMLVSTEEKTLYISDVFESKSSDTSDYEQNSAAISNGENIEDEVLSSRLKNNEDGMDVLVCGATTKNGSVCKRKPKEGNKRCWQHKGICYSLYGFESSSSSVICRITLQDGSICMRIPAPGRKRCEQHKGRRL